MERPFTEIALVWIAMVAAACAARSSSALGWTSPPNVPPSDAAAYEGQVVRVVGTVATAEATEGRTVLTLAGTPEDQFRIVIAPPLIGPRPVELAAQFRGRDIEAEGKVDDLGGPLEMLVGDPQSIRVTDGEAPADDAAAAPAKVAAAPQPHVEAPAAARAEPPLAPAPAHPVAAAGAAEPRRAAVVEEPAAEPAEASPEEAPALAAAAPEPPPPSADTEAASTAAACERARRSWREAATAARAPVARLDRCLAAGQAPCRTEAEALRRALAEVAASEERLGWLCTGGR